MIHLDVIHFRKKIFQEDEFGGDSLNSSFADIFQNTDYLNGDDAVNAAEMLMQWLLLLPTVTAFGLFWLERVILTLLLIMY